MKYRIDRLANEYRRVINDSVLESLWKVFRQAGDRPFHGIGRGQSIRTRTLGNHERHGRLVVQITVDRVVARTQLDLPDIFNLGNAASLAGLEDDGAKLLRRKYS